jgi:hypothetical protein
VQSSYPEEAQERSAAAAAVRDTIGRELRKMYECELARPLPNKFARLLNKLGRRSAMPTPSKGRFRFCTVLGLTLNRAAYREMQP